MDGQVLMNTEELITQNYSSSHKAIDIVGEGHSIDDVVAVSDGIVEVSVNTVNSNNTNARGTASYGNYVKIRHDDGTKSLYAHMEYGSVSVKTGDRVSKGQKIGRMGNTGNAHGIHLHFEIRNSDETRVNPISFFETKEEPTVSETKMEQTDETPVIETAPTVPQNKTESTITNETTKEVPKASPNQTYNSNIISNTADLNSTDYLSNPSYTYGSIVDALKDINIDSSYDYREKIAHINGISDYQGTYNQNVYLLSLLKQGKLKKA